MTRGKTLVRVFLVLAILPAFHLALGTAAPSHGAGTGQASPALQDTEGLEQ